MAFMAAGKKVEVVRGRYADRHTWLEAVFIGNVSGRKVAPNSSFYNEVLLGKEDGKFKPVPDEIVKLGTVYTGTFGMIGAKGKPLGKSIETECNHWESKKTVIVRPGEQFASLVDTLVTCDHGFAADGTPHLLLSDAKTGSPIRDGEQMEEAKEILLTLGGPTSTFKIWNRYGGTFESFGDEKTHSYISYSSVAGLLVRGYTTAGRFHFDFRDVVDLGFSAMMNAFDLKWAAIKRLGVVGKASDAIVAGNNAPIV